VNVCDLRLPVDIAFRVVEVARVWPDQSHRPKSGDFGYTEISGTESSCPVAHLDLNSSYPVSTSASGRRRRMLVMQMAETEAQQTSGSTSAPSTNPSRPTITSAPPNDVASAAAIARIRELVDDTIPRTWIFTGDGFGFETRLAQRSWTEHFTDVIRGRLARGKDVVLDTTASHSTFAGLLRNLDWKVLRFQPDVVVISAGPDDVLRAGDSRESLQAAMTELTEFLHDEGCVVVLCSPPLASGVTQEQMIPLLDTLQSVALRCQAVFVDHYTLWCAYQTQTGKTLDLLDASATVPSAAGHRKLARDLITELGIVR